MLIYQIQQATKYMNDMTQELNVYLKKAYDFLKEGNAVDAQAELLSGYQYYQAHKEELQGHLYGLTEEGHLKPKHSAGDNFMQASADYHQAEFKLAKVHEILNAVYDLTSTAAHTEKAAAEAKRADEIAKQAAQEAKEKYEKLLGITKEEPANIDMQILGGFIAALGVTAVAIAFVALNAAGLTMPGLVLAGFGVGATLLGCSIFSSTAQDIDEYTNNAYAAFGMA